MNRGEPITALARKHGCTKVLARRPRPAFQAPNRVPANRA